MVESAQANLVCPFWMKYYLVKERSQANMHMAGLDHWKMHLSVTSPAKVLRFEDCCIIQRALPAYMAILYNLIILTIL